MVKLPAIYLLLLAIKPYTFRWLGLLFLAFCINQLSISLGFAQKKFLRFESISIEQGLSQSSAICLLQDQKGFLWVGTADGLNRYDGYNFKVYRKDFLNKKSIGNNYINDLIEDEEGNIWVATRAGLCKYDWQTDSFVTYLFPNPNPAYSHFLSLALDKTGKIWIGAQHKGIMYFDKKSKSFDTLAYSPALQTICKKNLGLLIVNDVCFDKDEKNLWVATEYGLLRYNLEKKAFSLPYLPQVYTNNAIPDTGCSILLPDEQGNVWVGTYNGAISRWNKTSNDFYTIKLPTAEAQPYGANRVKALLQNSQNSWWVGTLSTGLYHVQLLNEKVEIQNFLQDNNDKYSLKDNDIVSILTDKSGLLWVGSFGGGLFKHDDSYNMFNAYTHPQAHPQNVVQNGIRSVLEDSKGNLWIGMTNRGLKKFDADGKTLTNYEYKENDPNSLTSNRINAVFEDKKGRIWVGCGDGGLSLFVPPVTKLATDKGKFFAYKYQQNELFKPLQATVYTINEDENQNLWLGTLAGLVKFDSTRSQVEVFKEIQNNPNSIVGDAVRAINIDNEKKQLWIGTFGGGLTLFDLKSNTFKRFTKDLKLDGSSISDNAVSSIYKDNYGTVWIGTFGGGLNKLDNKTKKFTYITENNGIANNVVYGILEDKQNNLWLSTNHGVTRYNILSQQALNYNLADGLQSDEFNANAYHKGKSGRFYFGGINGLTSFKPDSLADKVQNYPVLFTDFKLFNKSVIPDSVAVIQKHISETQEIVLAHTDYVFSFEFAALNFNTPHRVRYAYKMQGFDKEWIYTNANNRSANYSNLPAGSYVLQVKATNSNGSWMDKQAEIKIRIKPAIWNTWWFKVCAFLLVILAIVIFVSLRIRRIQQQREELESTVRLRTGEIMQQKEEIAQQRDTIETQLHQLETVLTQLRKSEHELSELNEAKNKFFSIFAHDLRSPLNSLKGFSSLLANFADELSKEEIKSIAHDLDKNITNSTKYLENLLTWARSQMNSIEFKPESLSLLHCVQTSMELLQVNAQAKNIAVLCSIASNLTVWADANQLKTILTNLIANAIKFTPQDGKVSIGATPQIPQTNETQMILINVTDTGVGMSETVTQKIFRIDSKHSTKGTAGESGTGLGLLICKEFVEKNGGEIWVESQEEQGTTFYFTLKS